jgi:hypothetical protein
MEKRPNLSALRTSARASRPPAATAARHDFERSASCAIPVSRVPICLAMSDYRREEAINETRARQTNEWIEESNDKFGADHPMDEYRCECSDGRCEDIVSLTRNEYEAVRADGLRFFIAVDHENPELDRLVAAHERYSIVAKLPGEPARIALDSDPRKD